MAWDPKRKGYIGVTRQSPKERWEQHRNRSSSNPLVGKKIREYGLKYPRDMHILKEGLSGAQAREEEHKYRPEENIGWNEKRGGESGIDDNQTGYYLYWIAPKRRVKRFVMWAVVVLACILILLGGIF